MFALDFVSDLWPTRANSGISPVVSIGGSVPIAELGDFVVGESEGLGADGVEDAVEGASANLDVLLGHLEGERPSETREERLPHLATFRRNGAGARRVEDEVFEQARRHEGHIARDRDDASAPGAPEQGNEPSDRPRARRLVAEALD